MIKRFLQKVFSKRTKATVAINQADSIDTSMAKKITAKTHKIDKGLISQAALKTCDGLQKAGFEAFIVGGAVRDLLLNFKPKDFDKLETFCEEYLLEVKKYLWDETDNQICKNCK